MTIANLAGAAFRAALNAALDTQSRNKIIGGDFTTNPWQRGTSFTAPASLSYLADSFYVARVSDAVVDILKTADAPTPVQAGMFTQHCLHADVTTEDAAIAAGQQYQIIQKIEGLNAASFGFGQAGTRYVTLSFWHKHTKTGTYCVSFRNSAADRSYIAEYTQAVTDTWEKAIITIPVDTSGTWLYDTGIGLSVSFVLAAGSTYQTAAGIWTAGNYMSTANQVNALDSTSNNFKLALIQLEAGSVASAFEALRVGEVLALCQRYYYRTTIPYSAGFVESTSTAFFIHQFPETMRTAPTALEQNGTAGDYTVRVGGGTSVACTSVPTFQSATVNAARTTFTTGAVLTIGQAACSQGNGYLGWSADL